MSNKETPINTPQAVAAMEILYHTVGDIPGHMFRASVSQVAVLLCAQVSDVINRLNKEPVQAAIDVNKIFQGANRTLELYVELFCALEHGVKKYRTTTWVDGIAKKKSQEWTRPQAVNEIGVLVQKIIYEFTGVSGSYKKMAIQSYFDSIDDMFDAIDKQDKK